MTIRERVRQSIAARTDELRREREAGRGWWAQLRALFVDLEEEAEQEVEERRQEHDRRLAHNPLAFETWEDFRAHRRKLGLRTRRRPPRRGYYRGLD